MKLYAVVVNKDDTVRVVSRGVAKQTPQYYFLANVPSGTPWEDERAFGYRARIEKSAAHINERSALEHYMERRQRDKQNALSVAGQATRQIASANELLMHFPDAVKA